MAKTKAKAKPKKAAAGKSGGGFGAKPGGAKAVATKAGGARAEGLGAAKADESPMPGLTQAQYDQALAQKCSVVQKDLENPQAWLELGAVCKS